MANQRREGALPRTETVCDHRPPKTPAEPIFQAPQIAELMTARCPEVTGGCRALRYSSVVLARSSAWSLPAASASA